MFFRFFPLLALGLLVSGNAPGQDVFRLIPAFSDLVLPDNASAVAVVPDDSGRVIAGLQRGLLNLLPPSAGSTEMAPFLDLRVKLKEEQDFEEGLHGIAFHPNFKTNRRVYLSYSQHFPRRTVLSEFIVSTEGPLKADPGTERILLEYPHPLGNHWGGGLAFGPEGYLYMGIGDGGLRDDPYRLSQNLFTLHGKIIRLDVDSRSPGLPYGIPADNPFVNKQEIRDEIWASGFRNPWGMAFDRPTGNLWCADVGQDLWEEVNLIKRGANYGWSERDGPERFARRGKSPEEEGPFEDPIHAYPHSEGISVTGGFVYRGKRMPSLQGCYLFADWGTGKVWALPADIQSGSKEAPRLLFAKSAENHPTFNPTVFAADASGEPLLFSHSPAVVYTLEENRQLAVSDEVEISPEESPSPLPLSSPEEPEAPVEMSPEEEATISI